MPRSTNTCTRYKENAMSTDKQFIRLNDELGPEVERFFYLDDADRT
jgi:hypothetical protein